MALSTFAFVLENSDIKALAATDVTTWSALKTNIEKKTSGTYTFAIKEVLVASSTINIPSGVTVILTYNRTKTDITEADIKRDKSFHGHLFYVEGTLEIKCSISGNSLSTTDCVRKKIGSLNAYSNDKYYGLALIYCSGGTVKMTDSTKSILKHNYNRYISGTDNEPDFNVAGEYSFSLLGIGDNTTNVRGSAIAGNNGNVQLTAGKIYGCVGDNGPAVNMTANTNDSIVLGGSTGNLELHDNFAFRIGGACMFTNSTTNTSVSKDAKFNFVINENTKIYNNISGMSGGALWTGAYARTAIKGGDFYNNHTFTSGGAMMLNAGGDTSVSYVNNISAGITYITGANIYNNSAEDNGGGIYTLTGSDKTKNKLILAANAPIKIYNNHANGTTTLSELEGCGGGIYINQKTTFIMGTLSNDWDKNVFIYNNVAHGGELDNQTEMSGRGGGIYIASNTDSTIGKSYVFNNTAEENDPTGNSLPMGGGIFTNSSVKFTSTSVNTGITALGSLKRGAPMIGRERISSTTMNDKKNIPDQLYINSNTTIKPNVTIGCAIIYSEIKNDIGNNTGIVVTKNASLDIIYETDYGTNNQYKSKLVFYGTGRCLRNNGTVKCKL